MNLKIKRYFINFYFSFFLFFFCKIFFYKIFLKKLFLMNKFLKNEKVKWIEHRSCMCHGPRLTWVKAIRTSKCRSEEPSGLWIREN